jgi:Mn-containing catalase
MSSPEAPPEAGAEDAGDLLADIGEETAKIREIASRIAALEDGAELSDEMVQDAMTALTRLYTVKFQLGERWSPFSDSQVVPATSVMIMTTAMCRAVNVELFELGMWQAWSGV